MNLCDRILKGEPRAMARAMTLVENGDAASRDILKTLFASSGQALIVGVTGAPGSGKSTLVDRLTRELRRCGRSVGIVAVDPTSPFSGGAILADRIRMNTFFEDEGVFVRSMATRGHLGGLARTTQGLVSILDAAGKDVVLIETVGVGQGEVEIVKVADVSLVLLVPGMGDDVQAFKAGVMEIGDVFVINKADHPQVETTEKELRSALALASRSDGWIPPIVRTVAVKSEGIVGLMDAIEAFDTFRKASAQRVAERKRGIEQNLLDLLREALLERAVLKNGVWDKIQTASQAVRERRTDPYTAVDEIVRELGDC